MYSFTVGSVLKAYLITGRWMNTCVSNLTQRCSIWYSKQGQVWVQHPQSEDILTKRGQNLCPRFMAYCNDLHSACRGCNRGVSFILAMFFMCLHIEFVLTLNVVLPRLSSLWYTWAGHTLSYTSSLRMHTCIEVCVNMHTYSRDMLTFTNNKCEIVLTSLPMTVINHFFSPKLTVLFSVISEITVRVYNDFKEDNKLPSLTELK